jgi:hypothetical protein
MSAARDALIQKARRLRVLVDEARRRHAVWHRDGHSVHPRPDEWREALQRERIPRGDWIADGACIIRSIVGEQATLRWPSIIACRSAARVIRSVNNVLAGRVAGELERFIVAQAKEDLRAPEEIEYFAIWRKQAEDASHIAGWISWRCL